MKIRFLCMAGVLALSACAAQDPIKRERPDGKIYQAQVRSPSGEIVVLQGATQYDCMNKRSTYLRLERGSTLVATCAPVDG